MLLSARVPVTAWLRRARVCLVLVALEQSSDRRSVHSCLRCNGFGNLIVLVRSSAVRVVVRSSTRTATTGVRSLLESSVARVLLGIVAAAAAAVAEGL